MRIVRDIDKFIQLPLGRLIYRQIVRIREQGLIGRIKFVGGNLITIGTPMVLRFIAGKGEALVQRFPRIKCAAIWVIERFPVLMRLAPRFSDLPISTTFAQKNPSRFEELRSTRIMLALAQLPSHGNDGPVIFLEVSDDVY